LSSTSNLKLLEFESNGKAHKFGYFHLLLERKISVFVRIEETNQLVKLAFTGSVVVVFFEEIEQFETVDATASITIDSLECGMRSEVSNLAKSLSKVFEGSLAVANCDK
jgi:hypothetical protein